MAKKVVSAEEKRLAETNLNRYMYGRFRGHYDYIEVALENEKMYLGRGLQWSESEREELVNTLGRPVYEINGIFPAVNTATGMQIKTRMDITYKGRGDGADEETAKVISKVAMQICHDAKYPWKESLAFADGLILQRGYLDIRMVFDDTINGVVGISVVHPFDVIPDPDAAEYDPDTWKDVCVVRWYTLDDIEMLYGAKKAQEVEDLESDYSGTADIDGERDVRLQFGGNQIVDFDYYLGITRDDDARTARYPVIDRQYWRYEPADCYILETGDIIPVSEVGEEQEEAILAAGGIKTKRIVRRVRWTVSCGGTVLHDDWSPYKRFTIIPYFPYFRHGATRGMVDNIVDPQRVLNKSWSLYLELLGKQANSGWMVEQGSLTNMETDDLETEGSKNGLVVEYRKGSTPPQKIQPGPMPQNVDRAIDRAELAIKTVSGMSDAMQGLNGREISGKAIETKQYQGQTQLTGPIDNLAMTRFFVARAMLDLVQAYYTTEQVIHITSGEPSTGHNEEQEQVVINQYDPATGTFINDVTAGKYDVVVTERPVADTYRDNQFQQAMEMREKGIPIPDEEIIRLSNLAAKQQILEKMAESNEPPVDPVAEADAEYKMAQAEKTRAEAVNKQVDALYSALQAAGVIRNDPGVAPLADVLARSAGYEDKDVPPLIPGDVGQGQGSDIGELPPNTNPTTPVPPREAGPMPAEGPAPGEVEGSSIGANRGIETQRIE